MDLRIYPVACCKHRNFNLSQIPCAIEHRPWTFTTPDPVCSESIVVHPVLCELVVAQSFELAVLLWHDNVVVLVLLETGVPQTALSAHISVLVRQCFVRNNRAEVGWLLHRCPVASHAIVADPAHGDLARGPFSCTGPLDNIAAVYIPAISIQTYSTKSFETYRFPPNHLR